MFEAISKLFKRPASLADEISLEIRGRGDRIIVHRGSRTMTIDSEVLMEKGATLVIYAGSIVAWDDGAEIAPPEREALLAAVRDRLDPDWGGVEVDDTPYDAPRLEALRWARERDKGLK